VLFRSLDAWLRGPLRDWAESLLSPDRLGETGLLDVAAVRRTWSEHLRGRRNHQRALWTVLMLQAWLERQDRTSLPRCVAMSA
jgi:asparagine synthase (glutamine-hydrolysing)